MIYDIVPHHNIIILCHVVFVVCVLTCLLAYAVSVGFACITKSGIATTSTFGGGVAAGGGRFGVTVGVGVDVDDTGATLVCDGGPFVTVVDDVDVDDDDELELELEVCVVTGGRFAICVVFEEVDDVDCVDDVVVDDAETTVVTIDGDVDEVDGSDEDTLVSAEVSFCLYKYSRETDRHIYTY
jgi:hypothetical protein